MASASTADHHSIRGYVLTAIRTAVLLVIICASLLASGQTANAVVQRIYTFPFFSDYYLSCGFGCYSGHQGTDYQLSPLGSGGERVSAAMAGTAKVCDDPFFPGAGHYIVMNHGNGHITRYLHLSGWAVANGVVRGRGGLIGYEGNSGVADGSYHLHFETRHGASTFTCGSDGTAVNPYSGSTYMWLTNPPSYAHKINDFNGDGFSDTLSFNASGQAIVGLNNVPTPTFQPLGNWGTVFSFATGEIPSTGDFNRDGYTDTIAFVPSRKCHSRY
jgi:hypothetical protein